MSGKKIGMGINKTVDLSHKMMLNDNKIDYWDPNKIVDHLQLFEASRQAGHNAYNNEILSIIEKFCQAILIIN